jgi:hypothetical protein
VFRKPRPFGPIRAAVKLRVVQPPGVRGGLVEIVGR